MITPELLSGMPQVFNISGVADALTVDLQPPAGEIWVVVAATGQHNDTSAQTVGWEINDGTDIFVLTVQSSTAQYASIALYSLVVLTSLMGTGFGLPIVLNERTKATFRAAAIGSGKHLIVRAIIMVYKGNPPWGDPV